MATPKEDETADRLAKATSALAIGNEGGALTALLDAWGVSRDPRVARVVELVSQQLAARRSPIQGKTRKEIHAEWLSVAAKNDPADMPRLLASLTLTFKRATDALVRLNALRKRPPDPRTAAIAVTLLRSPEFYASSTKTFWRALLDMIVRHADPRAASLLTPLQFDRIIDNPWGGATSMIVWFTRNVEATIASLQKLPPPRMLSTAAAARLDELEKRFTSTSDDALLAAIAADPSDDGARMVYADRLLERNDPRGELITLQLSKKSSPDADDRVKALIAEHWRTWLGPLAPLVHEKSCTFERGFPSRVVLSAKATHQAIADLVGHPIWTTVRELTFPSFETLLPELEALLFHPVMQSLEHVGDFERQAMLSIIDRAEPTRFKSIVGGAPETRAEEERFARTRALPDVRAWSVTWSSTKEWAPQHFRWLWSCPLGRDLTRIVLPTGIASLAAWVKELTKMKDQQIKIRSLEVFEAPWDWTAELTRDDAGRFSIMRTWRNPSYRRVGAATLCKALQAMPARSLTQLRLETPLADDDAPELQRAIKHLQIPLLEIPTVRTPLARRGIAKKKKTRSKKKRAKRSR